MFAFECYFLVSSKVRFSYGVPSQNPGGRALTKPSQSYEDLGSEYMPTSDSEAGDSDDDDEWSNGAKEKESESPEEEDEEDDEEFVPSKFKKAFRKAANFKFVKRINHKEQESEVDEADEADDSSPPARRGRSKTRKQGSRTRSKAPVRSRSARPRPGMYLC